MTLEELIDKLNSLIDEPNINKNTLIVINDADTSWYLKLSEVYIDNDKIVLASKEYQERVDY